MIVGKKFINSIQREVLPEEKAHSLYSPPYRPILSYEEILSRNPRMASVNVLLTLKNDEWVIPLMLRTNHKNDKHSGQISLPGGSKEENDLNFSETAIRETSEEIGIHKAYIKIIRELSPIYILPSNFYVKVFLSFTKRNPNFILQESEAQELLYFPVESLLNLPELPPKAVFSTSRNLEVPYIPIGNHKIWGATAMILSEVAYLLKKISFQHS